MAFTLIPLFAHSFANDLVRAATADFAAGGGGQDGRPAPSAMSDAERAARYQTVFARVPGSVAAPKIVEKAPSTASWPQARATAA